MKKVQVRVWKRNLKYNGKVTVVFISNSSDNYGYDLYICNVCGHIYAINITNNVYTGSTTEKLLFAEYCIDCHIHLSESARQYPETFLTPSGEEGHYNVDYDPINDEDVSEVIELDCINS